MDIFGRALFDYYKKGSADILWLYNSYGEPEEMPVDIFFRTKTEMPTLELMALDLIKGSVLDIGAGVGSHALILQEQGVDVSAIDISPGAVEIMKHRGIKNAFEQDFFLLNDQYDTLLLLMNGIGLAGTLKGLTDLLSKAKKLIKPGGQLIFDSSDITYLYEGLEMPAHHYFGEVSYSYQYQHQQGAWFNWLYIDQQTLKNIAAQQGWQCEIIFDDGEDQYLARLVLAN